MLPLTPVFWSRYAKDVGRMGPTYCPPYSSARIGSSKKGTWHPRVSRDSGANAATHLFRYRLHCRDISKRSVVDS